MSISAISPDNYLQNVSLNNMNSNLSGVNTAENVQNTEDSQPKTLHDSFVLSFDTENDTTGIYSKESIAKQLADSENQRAEAFASLLSDMLVGQHQAVQGFDPSAINNALKVADEVKAGNLSIMGFDFYVSAEQSANAQAAISEGGEYSVENVSDRIMEMAKALAGGDETKLSLLKDAIEKGFGNAMSSLGFSSDDMPEITKKTYDSVMSKFDEWEQSFKTPETKNEENNVTAQENQDVINNTGIQEQNV